MRTTARIVLLVLAAALLAAFLWGLSSSPDEWVGKAAPPTQGTDADGAAFRLADYRGQVVILDFWADW